MIEYGTHYRKGFHGNKGLWNLFRDAVLSGDCNEIHDVLDARRKELGIEGKAPAVDPDVHAAKFRDSSTERDHKVVTPAIGGDRTKEEWQYLNSLVSRQHVPFDQLSDLPDGMTKVSWFLRNQMAMVPDRNSGFMTTKDSFEHVQKGLPVDSLTRKPASITDGFSAGWFVHDDNPLQIYQDAIADLLRLGCEYKIPNSLRDSTCHRRFSVFGTPYLQAAIGQVATALCVLSFREKWRLFFPRPEQFGVDAGLGYLNQIFPEGSPYHPSRSAMHLAIYAALGGWMLEMFDDFFILPNGSTIKDEIDLLIQNGGMWREWARVHFPSDNAPYVSRYMSLGRKKAKALLITQ